MALDPVVIALSASGEDVARRIATHLRADIHGREGRTSNIETTFPNALEHIRDLFAAKRPIIGVCASGILIRAVAPLLNDKTSEPPVISVSDDGGIVIPLLGGHRGANRLARDIAQFLKGKAAVTTAGDVALGVSLDEPPLGYKLANPENAKPVMAQLLSGAGAVIKGDAPWLSMLPKEADDNVTISVSETPTKADLQFYKQTLSLGVGCIRNAPFKEVEALILKSLKKAHLSPHSIAALSTIELKADEPALNLFAKKWNIPLRLFTHKELEALTPFVKNPSDIVFQEVGCHSVAEASALAQAGEGAKLLVEKQKNPYATCAIATSDNTPLTLLKGRGRGCLALVGIGPGKAEWRTPEASRLINEADILVGYNLYLDLLGPIAAGKERVDFPLGKEEERCRYALEAAAKGKRVALICSGDAGIYAMGALVFELLDRSSDNHGVSDAARRIDVMSAPGISALQAAAAKAGAPLGHDFCAISLSDLLTPREDILKRIKAAAMGDFVIAFYNPVSKHRRTLLREAQNILLDYRPSNCPVILARALGRDDEAIHYRSLKELKIEEVDMLTVVLIGSSNSKVMHASVEPKIYTPRGYARKIDGDLS